MQMNPLLLRECCEMGYWDKQSVGAINPMQKKMAQQDDVIS